MAESRHCPRCSGVVSIDAPEGLCPECLLQQAIAGPGPGQAAAEENRSPVQAFIPPPPAELARRFPQLEILELVGQGGMGAVYKARQPKLDRLVAVKILPPEVARDPAFAERFMREARSLARLNHPNIVTVFDFGQADGLYYFSMEFVDGKNVRELLEAGELAAPQALKIVPQVCDALQYAHDEGVVHRDIKPENILLDKRGRVKIADFGLAKLVGLTPAYLTLTGSREVMGTLYYMAPEQMKRTHQVDHRADLYSLGVVFYEMLTGELPVGRFAPPSHKARVDRRLDLIVLRALAREPEHRYQDAGDLKKDVESVASGRHQALEQAAQPTPVGARGNWPTVRFTIPHISWYAAEARGEIYRDQEALIVEYREIWAFRKSRPKEIRIPFSEIISISCQETEIPFSNVKSMSWLKKWGITELVIKAVPRSSLAALPAGKEGKGRLVVHWGDREAAKQLVDSVVRPSPREPVREAVSSAGESPAGKVFDPERIWLEVTTPAVGLLLTGVVAFIFAAAWVASMVMTGYSRPFALSEGEILSLLAMLPVSLGAGFLVTGAVRMLTLRSYAYAVSAAILAMVPWSPGWVFGLPFGIWALRVLRRPEVMAGFLSQGREARPVELARPKGKGIAAGKVLSLLRSVGGYFLPTFTGRKSSSRPDSSPPLARIDYSAQPAGAKRQADSSAP